MSMSLFFCTALETVYGRKTKEMDDDRIRPIQVSV